MGPQRLNGRFLGVRLPKNFADRDLIETSITFASRSAFFVVCSRAANAAFTLFTQSTRHERELREKCCIEDAGTVFTHIRSRIAFSIVRNTENSAAGRVDITSRHHGRTRPTRRSRMLVTKRDDFSLFFLNNNQKRLLM